MRRHTIVAHLKPGRQSDEETILFWHRGLSLMLWLFPAAPCSTKAKPIRIGQTLRFE